MSTAWRFKLNYWLGKLNQLQLLGHGLKPIVVVLGGKQYQIESVSSTDDLVSINIKE